MRLAHICAIAAVLAPQLQPPRTLDGRTVDPLHPEEGIRATALIFTRTDCPIANQAAPEIERVRALCADRGVRLWLVYVDPRESAGRVSAHLDEYGLRIAAIRDPGHALVRRAGVRVTPEAALYVHDEAVPRLVYRGRLDDRVAALGRQRPRATRFDLREAIESTLAGKTSTLVTTPAAGCAIADLR